LPLNVRRLWPVVGGPFRASEPDAQRRFMTETVRILETHMDRGFYLKTYADVAKAGIDPARHYAEHGWREGRNPTAWFSTTAYVARHPELVDEDVNPFVHYLLVDGRKPDPATSTETAAAPTPAKAPEAPPYSVPQPYFTLQRQAFATETTIYTAVIGARHLLGGNTTFWTSKIVFADKNLGIPGWDQRPVVMWDPAPKMMALFHKYYMPSLAEPGAKLIWIDSRVSVQLPVIERLAAELDRHDLCVFRHYERDCVYDEIDGVLAGRRAAEDECDEFRGYLDRRGFPRGGGLYETGVIGFRATPRLAAAMRRVFGLCHRYAPRDQLALPVVLAEAGLDVALYDAGRTNLRNTPGIHVHDWPKDMRHG
jgi:hypothetical protein